MTQLTLRGFDRELAAKLRLVAKQEGLSLNKAALKLMRRGAGLEPSPGVPNTVGDTLNAFIGTWSKAEEDERLEATRVFEHIDETFWA